VRRGAESAAVAVLLAGLTAVLTWPLVARLDSAVVDLGDPLYLAWVLTWDLHALAHDPLRLFDANIFHPHQWTLAYSDHLLGLVPLAAPVWLAGGHPVLVHNVLLFATFPLAGLTMFLLVRHLTRHAGAAALAGLLYAFCHYRFGQLSHLQLMSHQWLPLLLLGLHRSVAEGGRWPAVALAVAAFLVQALTSGVHTALTVITGGLFVAWVAGPVHRPPLDRVARRAAVAAALAALVLVPTLVPYYLVQQELGFVRGLAEVEGYSARPEAYLTLPPIHPWFETLGARFHRAEGSLFPGVVLAGLAVAGALRGRRRTRAPAPAVDTGPGRWPRWLDRVLASALLLIGANTALLGGFVFWLGPLRVSHHRFGGPLLVLAGALLLRRAVNGRPVPLPGLGWLRRLGWPNVPGYYVALTLVGAVGSFGPTLWIGETPVAAPLYRQLYELVPGFAAFRVPSRFALLVMTGLAVLAGYGAAAIARATAPVARVAVLGVLGGLAVLEVLAAPLPFASAPPVPGDADRWLAAAPAPGPVVVLPLHPESEAYAEAARLVGSTAHWRPLVNGYAGFFPPGYWATVESLNAFPAPDAVARLRALGVRYVVVHLGQLRDEARARMDAALRALPAGVVLVATFEETVILEVRPARRPDSGAETGGASAGRMP